MPVLSLLVLGISSAVAQVVMTRELMISFYGNEFFTGWTLAGWLLWTGAGSLFAAGSSRLRSEKALLAACHLLVPLCFCLGVLIVRSGKILLLSAPGQIPDLGRAMAVSFFAQAALCPLLGMQFSLTARHWLAPDTREVPGRPGKSYLWETLGFAAGGLLFGYGLVRLDEFKTAAWIFVLNLAAAFPFLCSAEKSGHKKYLWATASALAVLTAVCFAQGPRWNLATAALRFPGERLIETTNSVYGNIAVTQTGNQYNFYQNGLLTGPGSDALSSEYAVHFALLSHPGPKKILLAGTGFNGALGEILKHGPDLVYYAETDPSLPAIAGKYLDPALKTALGDRRVVRIPGDLRHHLSRLPRDFDSVIINLGNPSTAALNRYFSLDFFQGLRSHLKPDGLIATRLAFSANAVPPALENLGACIAQTLQAVFPNILLLPEDSLFLIASSSPLPADPQRLIERMGARNLQTDFVTPSYLNYRFTNDRIRQTSEIFKTNRTAGLNEDPVPRGYFYNLIHWLGIFHPATAALFSGLAGIRYPVTLIFAALLTALPFLVRGRKDPAVVFPSWLMGLSGFSLMSAEMVVIYGFQVFYGNLYYKIAWIFAAFTLGAAAGTCFGNRHPLFKTRSLGSLHALNGVCLLAGAVLFRVASRPPSRPSEFLWYLAAAGLGALTGCEFPWLADRLSGKTGAGGGFSAGKIYAADLFGSCLGALATGIFLLPAYGVLRTLALAAAIHFTAALCVFSRRD